MRRASPALLFAALAAAGGLMQGGPASPVAQAFERASAPMPYDNSATPTRTAHRSSVSKLARLFARSAPKWRNRRFVSGLGYSVAEGKRRARKARNRAHFKKVCRR